MRLPLVLAAAALAVTSPALAGAPGTVTSAAGQPIPAWAVSAPSNVTVKDGLFNGTVGAPVPVDWITIQKPGAWGLTEAQIRDERTSNDQFDPYPGKGSYTNTGGATKWTLREKLAAPTTKAQRYVTIDWADRPLGYSNRISFRGRKPNGKWIDLGTVKSGGRLDNGNVLSIQVAHPDQKIGMVEATFTQRNFRDIVATQLCSCRKAPTVEVSNGKTAVAAKAGTASATSDSKATTRKASKAAKATRAR